MVGCQSLTVRSSLTDANIGNRAMPEEVICFMGLAFISLTAPVWLLSVWIWLQFPDSYSDVFVECTTDNKVGVCDQLDRRDPFGMPLELLDR